MGMFDTFIGEVKCPKCHKVFNFEEQTKDYECILADLKLGDYVSSPVYVHPSCGLPRRDYYYCFDYKCPSCGAESTYAIVIKDLQIVDFITKEEATEEFLSAAHQIEPFFQRKKEWKNMAAKLEGFDEFADAKYKKDEFLSTLSKGDNIILFGKEFTIDKVYRASIADLPANAIYHIWYDNAYFLKGHFPEGEERVVELNIGEFRNPIIKRSMEELIGTKNVNLLEKETKG